MIGKEVTVVVDRPIGSRHPTYAHIVYTVNYGYIEGIIAGDGEEQDAYILGVDTPVESFRGVVVAIIRRRNDVEEKWVVAPKGRAYAKEQIWQAVAFQEQYFDIEISI